MERCAEGEKLPIHAFFANATNTLGLTSSDTPAAAANIISTVNLPGRVSPNAMGYAR